MTFWTRSKQSFHHGISPFLLGARIADMQHVLKLVSAGLLTGVLFGCSTAGGGGSIPAAPPVSTDSTTSTEPSAMSTTTSTSVPSHVMTGDYFDSPWGTTSVSP